MPSARKPQSGGKSLKESESDREKERERERGWSLWRERKRERVLSVRESESA